ncbi:integrase arm-type DNA-binding domain-containing protein [Bradyrhizobium sp. AZCC 2289]|uniref:integrase arm-type DNA-binding domain-containing protein n=1 Tax=Bradyrhizobium sp. AZCC 2289 TaxID=3117026 RepID=UPI003FA5B320
MEVRGRSSQSAFNGGADGGADMAKRQLHKLSAREAETITEPGRHSDGGGLYLAIETGAHGRRQWIFMYRVRGTSKRREIGLGPGKGRARTACRSLMLVSRPRMRARRWLKAGVRPQSDGPRK